MYQPDTDGLVVLWKKKDAKTIVLIKGQQQLLSMLLNVTPIQDS